MVVHGNRGKCAQPCRLPYQFKSKEKTEGAVSEIISQGYLLSTRDLCGLEFIPELIKAGVMCFKIEGRMKSPEYVATVTRIYRKYIDLALSDKQYKIDKKDVEDLMQVFNRGNFSTGHLDTLPNKELVYPQKQNHIGICIGNVSNIKQNKGHILMNLINSLSIGDTLTFEKEPTKYTVSELMLKGKNIPSAEKGQFVEIGRMKGNINIGDKVYRIASKELSNFAKETYKSESRKVFLKGSISLKKGEPIVFKVATLKNSPSVFNNINIEVASEATPVVAKNKPITRERILEQLTKTGDTIFEFDNIDIKLEDDLFIPSIKVLNELRRNALEEVLLTAKSKIIRNISSVTNLKEINTHSANTKPISFSKSNRKISLLLNVLNENTNYLNIKNVDNIYIPLKYFSNKKYEDIIDLITRKYNTYIYLPTITKANYINLLRSIVTNSISKYRIKGFVVSNLCSAIFIAKIQEKYKDKYEFIGNYTLNVYNKNSISEYSNLGISKLTISPELDEKTIKAITNESTVPQELIIYGRTPLMNANYCFLGKTNKCYPTCGMHCQENKTFYLKDRMGFNFPVLPDNIQTVTTIYNSKITSIDGSKFNVASYRIDILEENIEEINSIIQSVLSSNRLEGKDYTNGNLNRDI